MVPKYYPLYSLCDAFFLPLNVMHTVAVNQSRFKLDSASPVPLDVPARRTSLPLPLRPTVHAWHRFRQRWTSQKSSIPLPLPPDISDQDSSSAEESDSSSVSESGNSNGEKQSEDVYYTPVLEEDEEIYDLMYVPGQGGPIQLALNMSPMQDELRKKLEARRSKVDQVEDTVNQESDKLYENLYQN